MNPMHAIGYHPARVLIVDDERHNRQLLEVMLAPEGLLIQTAGSGEEALAASIADVNQGVAKLIAIEPDASCHQMTPQLTTAASTIVPEPIRQRRGHGERCAANRGR